MSKLFRLIIFFVSTYALCNPEDIQLLKFKNELSNWAIEELMERQNHEKRYRERERSQKWLIAGIGTITTCIPLVTAIIQVIQNGSCTCEALVSSASLNIIW